MWKIGARIRIDIRQNLWYNLFEINILNLQINSYDQGPDHASDRFSGA